MRTRDVQVLQQSFALRHIMRPGDRLDPASGLTAFAAVKQDAGEMRRQMIEQFYFLVHAKRLPRLHDRIESAGRIHEKRRPGADHLVARDDAIDDRGGHSAGRLALRLYLRTRRRRG